MTILVAYASRGSDCHPVVGRFMKSEPRGIGEILAAIRPRDYRVFAGVIDGSRWPWWGRLVLRAFGGRPGDTKVRKAS
jgi:hypothetical protein